MKQAFHWVFCYSSGIGQKQAHCPTLLPGRDSKSKQESYRRSQALFRPGIECRKDHFLEKANEIFQAEGKKESPLMIAQGYYTDYIRDHA